ncbi:PRC-barrel domain-containing protein, partial [Arthrobacter sp. ZGTC212]|uniref:PRC-barrel domain-containing protein n=1 Tax=Arthrobacter sp. ZGTC212 TaxID=2058899 RepID=UPI0015E1CB70
MISTENLSALTTAGGHVVGSDGSKIGSIGQIYVDDQTSEPTWVTVKTGLFGSHESFAPLDAASQDGNDIVVAHTKDKVKDAPRVAPDGHLEPAEEDQLYTYYEDSSGFSRHDNQDTTGVAAGRGTVGHDTSGPTTDDAMTRSEEQLRVGTEKQAAGRARL